MVIVPTRIGITLKDYIGWTGKLNIRVSGFRRSTGERFSEWVDVPVEITK
jgi:hypothetical protein